MISKEQFEFGDVLATHGNSWLSKGIQFFMRLYMKYILHKPFKEIFNHNAVIINVYGEKWVSEAMGWGPRMYSIEDSGYLSNNKFIILRDLRGFNAKQIEDLSKKMISMSGIRYQYEAFFQWIGKIVFRRKTFHAHGETEVNCSELAAIAINAAHPGTFKRPNETSPMDHVIASNYKTIDINNMLNTK